MLWTAANTPGRTMTDVVGWVLTLDRPGEGTGGTLAPLVRLLTDHDDQAVAATARQVQGWLHGQWSTDPRTTSSVYATARNAVWPWADPQIAASGLDCTITLDWLLAGNNTLYLCAPLGDETRIGVVFAAVLHDLISQAFDRYNHTGAPAEPRLLVLLDEAANSPLPKLPQWASTVTGARPAARHGLAIPRADRTDLRRRRGNRSHQPPHQADLPQRTGRHRHPGLPGRRRRHRTRPRRPGPGSLEPPRRTPRTQQSDHRAPTAQPTRPAPDERRRHAAHPR